MPDVSPTDDPGNAPRVPYVPRLSPDEIRRSNEEAMELIRSWVTDGDEEEQRETLACLQEVIGPRRIDRGAVMAETKATQTPSALPMPQTVPREYAGRWIAWSPDGMRIVAVAGSSEEAERIAASAGFLDVALELVPEGRQRTTGAGP